MGPVRLGLLLEVARKEILSTVRDRRAIVSNVLIPLILLPALMLGLPLALGGLFERERETVTTLAVEGLEHLPAGLRQAIEGQPAELVAVDSAARAVRNDEAPAALVAPAELEAALAAGGRVELTVVRKSGSLSSELAAGKLQGAIEQYRRDLVRGRLEAAGVDPELLEPLAVRTLDASSPAERSSGQLSWLIPFFIAIWTLTGGQMAAIDATAGEKERGTLESLLVAPIRRSEVVFGKFLATLLFGLTAAVMAIVGVVAGGALLRGAFVPRLGPQAREMVAEMGGSLRITPEGFLLLVGSALLLAAAVAALLIAITLFARSFKEAQTYVAPLSFVMIVPAISLQFQDLLDVGAGVYWLPVLNVMVLIDDLVRGRAEAGAILITWGVMLALVTLLLAFAHRNFLREGVIFRS